VPLGTEIFEVKRNVGTKKLAKGPHSGSDIKIKICDLDEEGQKVRIVKGGAGGLGNYKDK